MTSVLLATTIIVGALDPPSSAYAPRAETHYYAWTARGRRVLHRAYDDVPGVVVHDHRRTLPLSVPGSQGVRDASPWSWEHYAQPLSLPTILHWKDVRIPRRSPLIRKALNDRKWFEDTWDDLPEAKRAESARTLGLDLRVLKAILELGEYP